MMASDNSVNSDTNGQAMATLGTDITHTSYFLHREHFTNGLATLDTSKNV